MKREQNMHHDRGAADKSTASRKRQTGSAKGDAAEGLALMP